MISELAEAEIAAVEKYKLYSSSITTEYIHVELSLAYRSMK